MAKVLALHGPNLNLLGDREPHIYGSDSLEDINKRCQNLCASKGHEFVFLQSNAEADFINRLHDARTDGTEFMIVNFGDLPIRVWPFETQYLRLTFLLLRYTFQIFFLERNIDNSLSSVISHLVV